MIEQWHILGAGAMGRLFACKLARAGLDPVLIKRGGPAGRETVKLRDGTTETAFELAVLGSPSLGSEHIRGLFVTTKANHAEAAIGTISHAICAGAPVILLHNGMGVREQLSKSQPQLSLFSGTTTEGAYLAEDGAVVHAGQGETGIGRSGQDAAPAWFNDLVTSNERFHWEADIDASQWRKLLINCAINPLTALHRCRNGALLDNPALRAEVELLCEELSRVSAARGNARGASCALDWALAVIQGTADNQSSMLQDVLSGRETEIEYITGFFCREARRLNIGCPHNEALLQQIRQLDRGIARH